MLSRCHNIIIHAVAVNEHRGQFHGRSIFNNQAQANEYNNKVLNGTHYLELGFLGAHSDIGGGYKDGDLSNVSLMWMIKQAQEKGSIKFGKYISSDFL